jgi:hypothetical protein
MLLLRMCVIFLALVLLTRAPWPVVRENPLWFLLLIVCVITIGSVAGRALLRRKHHSQRRCVHIEQNPFDVAIQVVGQSKIDVIGFSWDGPQHLDDGQYHLHVTVIAVPVGT